MSTLALKGLTRLRDLDSLVSESKAQRAIAEQFVKLSVDLLSPGKFQPRKHISEQALNELANSIKTHGVIQPLIVRKIDTTYEIIAGERRWHAAKLVGLIDVPAIIRNVDDEVALAFSLIENIQRENLNPVEEAESFARFNIEFSMTHEDIAKRVGRSRASVTNTLRLLSLTEPVKKLLEEVKINMGHARALLSLDGEQQVKTALIVVENDLSVRKTEELVNRVKYSNHDPVKIKNTLSPDKYDYWQRELSEKFSTKVSLKLNQNGSGKIIIPVDSPDEIDWIIENMRIKSID